MMSRGRPEGGQIISRDRLSAHKAPNLIQGHLEGRVRGLNDLVPLESEFLFSMVEGNNGSLLPKEPSVRVGTAYQSQQANP